VSVRIEFVQVTDIDDRVNRFEFGVVESPLWQPANQRHLSALEPEAKTSAGTRFLSFVSLSTRLAMTRTLAAAEPLRAMFRTWTRF
jgi:hypothetical protein